MREFALAMLRTAHCSTMHKQAYQFCVHLNTELAVNNEEKWIYLKASLVKWMKVRVHFDCPMQTQITVKPVLSGPLLRGHPLLSRHLVWSRYLRLIQWNLDLMNLYITIFFSPAKLSYSKCMEKNLDITNLDIMKSSL